MRRRRCEEEEKEEEGEEEEGEREEEEEEEGRRSPLRSFQPHAARHGHPPARQPLTQMDERETREREQARGARGLPPPRDAGRPRVKGALCA